MGAAIDKYEIQRASREKHALALDYVRTIVIVAGIAFAVLELYTAAGDKRRLRFESSQQMIAAFGTKPIIDGGAALLQAMQIEMSPQAYQEILVRLTPLRQHLIFWTSCLKFKTCEEDLSLQLLCNRLVAYEYAFSEIQMRFGREYNQEMRDIQTHGYLATCRDSLEDATVPTQN